MNKLITNALEYLSSSFLVEVKVLESVDEFLPFQIKQKASAYRISIDGVDFLCVASDKLSVLTANNFLNIRKLSSKIQIPIIIISLELNLDARKVIRKLGWGWIVPNQFSFIPSLFIHREANELKESKILVDNEKKFGIIPSYLIAYYLCGYFNNGFVSSDIIEIFNVSKMAVSRAIKELVERSVINEMSKSKPRLFYFSFDRQTLWNQQRNNVAELSTGFLPVASDKIKHMDTFFVGETALSKYTLISPPSYKQLGLFMTESDRYMRPITPATIEGAYFFKALGLLELGNENLKEDVCLLQIFPYKPVIKNNYLDKVFLALSRVNKNDIRVKSSYFELETEIFQELNHTRNKP